MNTQEANITLITLRFKPHTLPGSQTWKQGQPRMDKCGNVDFSHSLHPTVIFWLRPSQLNAFRLETALFECHVLAVVYYLLDGIHHHGTAGYNLALQLSALSQTQSLIKI
jgi:hypothetical protein